MRIIMIIALLYGAIAEAAIYTETIDWVQKSVRVLSESHFDGQFKRFYNQKNQDFLNKYSFEANLAIDLAFINVNNIVFWMCRGELNAGMGESPWGLAIHPFDMNYGVIPAIEFRLPQLHISTGFDHRCFHYIDQKPPLPIVYWNRCFIAINSPDRRIYPRSAILHPDSGGTLLRHLTWSASWGYYVSEFFGAIRPINLMSLTRPHYLHQFDLSGRYGILPWKNGVLEITDAFMLGFKRNGRCYWSQEMGLEALFTRKTFDTSLYVRFTVDGGRFDSKDQLFEVGISASK